MQSEEYKPRTNAAELLKVLVQEIAIANPQAFKNIFVERALEEIDEAIETAERYRNSFKD